MWKDYSVGFIRNNRASSISIMVAAFISSLFLSFLCSMFYNVWVYEVEKIVLEEGDWQGRLTGVTDAGDLLTIENFANVEKAVVNIVVSFNRAVLCLASCRKIKQDDAVGSNQGNGCNRAEEKKAFSNSLNFIWYRGGTGGKCAEGAKESAAHFHIVSDLVIYGVYNDAVFFFSYRSQHQIHLFSALSGCLGYYDNNKRYQN